MDRHSEMKSLIEGIEKSVQIVVKYDLKKKKYNTKKK